MSRAPIDEHLRSQVAALGPGARDQSLDLERQLTYFTAMARSRHLDFAARRMQSEKRGFYTIGSAGHEANAAVALGLRPTDPALLHYRSGGFYCGRASQVEGHDPVRDVLLSLSASSDDPISGGRHKVFGSTDLHVIPQTSTIASHLPRAMGLAFSLGRAQALKETTPWPADALVVTSLGDASANHSTAVGALNAAGHCAHQGVPLPLLVVVEDNGIGISVKTPQGWTARAAQSWPGLDYVLADGEDPEALLDTVERLGEQVRTTRRPAILHLRTVRFMGHAGSDAEIAYRSPREIQADYARDPLLASARVLVERGGMSAQQVLDRYEQVRDEVTRGCDELVDTPHLSTAEQVMRPLTERREADAARAAVQVGETREEVFRGQLPEKSGRLTLAQSINAALTDLFCAQPRAIAFGEDVGVKGGVYGVTRGLRKRFGATRVFDTLLDEQTILGTALGASLAGLLPVPEIQYLAYVHNAIDQIRGEGATLRFFSNGQYSNGMLVRIQGLAYQRGFGGHFHNDNSVAALRDIPGIVLAVPSSAAEAPGLVRSLAGLALEEGRVCVLLEPIALYHSRDLHPDDGAWTAEYAAPADWAGRTPALGEVMLHRDGTDVLVITFGNGVPMTLRALDSLAQEGISATVMDLRWLTPLPVEAIAQHAARFPAVLVADESRRSGGVAESVLAALVDNGYTGRMARVNSEDSVIPLGPAAHEVLMDEDDIATALQRLCGHEPHDTHPDVPDEQPARGRPTETE